MNDPTLVAFLSGMVTAGFMAAGLFFVRFWVRSRDTLFLAFSAAFWLMAANQALVSLVSATDEAQSWFYLFRVAAFILIAAAIIRKNADDRDAK
jgi:hypothetical protein